LDAHHRHHRFRRWWWWWWWWQAAMAVRGVDRVVVATPEALALITPHWHCLVQRPKLPEEAAAPRLYAKPDDSFELSDVANRCPAVTEELQALAERVWAEGIGIAWSAQLSQATAASSGGYE
jgi:hypothetical protein